MLEENLGLLYSFIIVTKIEHKFNLSDSDFNFLENEKKVYSTWQTVTMFHRLLTCLQGKKALKRITDEYGYMIRCDRSTFSTIGI